jgi:hypothetical protein
MLATVKNPARLLIVAQLLLALTYTLPLFSSELLTDSDFISFYTGWTMLRNGDGARLYDVDLQRVYQENLWGPEGAPFQFRLLPFINPPHAALIFMPLSYLNPRPASLMFLGINCLAGLWVLRRLWQLSSGWTRPARIFLITNFWAIEIFWYGLAPRTLTLIVLACLIEYYRAIKDGRDVRAALWLVAATVKPQLILFPALIPFVLRRWRLILFAAGLGMVLAICISLALGFHIWQDYLRLLSEVSANGEAYGASPWAMNNLRMILYRILPTGAVVPLVYVGLVAGIAGTVWLWRSAQAFELKFALTILIGLFLAPHLNYQDTLIAFFPAVLLYDWARSKGPNLVKVFQWMLPIVTLVPPILIFSGYSRTLRLIWPLPLILILIGMCVRALRVEQHERVVC